MKDTTTDVAQQANQYLRSSAVLGRRTPDSFLSFEVTARQDIAWGGFSAFDNDVWPSRLYATQDSVGNPCDASRSPSGQLQRSLPRSVAARSGDAAATPGNSPRPALPAARRALLLEPRCRVQPPRPVQRPFGGRGGRRHLPAFQPVAGRSELLHAQCGVSRQHRTDLLSQGDRTWQCGERGGRRLRLDLVPQIAGTFALGDWLRIRQARGSGRTSASARSRGTPPSAATRWGTSSSPARSPTSSVTGSAMPSSRASSTGRFPGSGEAFRQPSHGPNQPVENRFYDEIDGALFQAPLRQGVARITQTLGRRVGAVIQELFASTSRRSSTFTRTTDSRTRS